MLPLQHGVSLSDLKCLEELWRKTKDQMHDNGTYLVNPDFSQLLDIHPEEDHPSGMTRRDHFNACVFLQTLVLQASWPRVLPKVPIRVG